MGRQNLRAAALVGALALLGTGAPAQAAEKKPNIVHIVADDPRLLNSPLGAALQMKGSRTRSWAALPRLCLPFGARLLRPADGVSAQVRKRRDFRVSFPLLLTQKAGEGQAEETAF